MTRIIALLSWYDEDPAWLTRCVESLNLLPADELIAVDGAYQHYPGAKAGSPPDQAKAIRDAWGSDPQAIIHRLNTPWPTEVDKRNQMFSLAEHLHRPGDWYFVIDADEYITAAPTGLHEQLERAPFDVGAIEMREPTDLGPIIYPTHPKFFRAIPGLRAVGDHFTYTTPDGRRLWGDQRKHRMEARADLTQVKVTHAKNLRHTDRKNAAEAYYRTRDALGLEDLPAVRHPTAIA